MIRILSVLALGLGLLPGPSVAAGDDLHNATLWMQASAEREALCRQSYALALSNLTRALNDPDWQALGDDDLDDGRQALADLPPAVILDIDETVLDNHWYEARLIRDGGHYTRESWTAWCEEEAATAIPGALQFCTLSERLGVAVFYVTNRRENVAAVTLANLRALGFPAPADGSTLLPRSDTSDKTARRAAIAADHRVLLLIGDSGGDFHADLAADLEPARSAVAGPFADRWGQSWIVLPNPMYGVWARGELSFSPEGHLEPHPSEALGASAARPDPPGQVPTAPTTPRHPLLRAGPMAAWSDVTAAAVWVQTHGTARVQLRFWPEGDPANSRLSESQLADESNDHIATFVLDDLPPGATIPYELYLDGERASLPWPLAVHTQPLWLWRGPGGDRPHDPPEFTFLLGSCNYVNEPPFDRPGTPYGAGHQIFEAMADVPAAFMLWLGDNTYFREGDTGSEAAMRRRYAHTRALPEMQRLLGSTQNIALWDDHDYGPDNSDRSFGMKAAARDIFVDYWPDRPRGTPRAPGTFRLMSYGDVDLFLLDDRTFRAPNDAPDGPGKVMLGAQQMRWLKDGLLDSHATFKLIVNGGQMLDPGRGHESWASFPDERDELLSFLAAQDIEGVFFLSGDRHQSELLLESREGEAPWYELTVSPLTAGPAGEKYRSRSPAQVPGSWVGVRNFGVGQVSGEWGERTLTFSLHDVDGVELWRRSFQQSELTAGG